MKYNTNNIYDNNNITYDITNIESNPIFVNKFNILYDKIKHMQSHNEEIWKTYFLHMKCQRVKNIRFTSTGACLDENKSVPYVKILKRLKERRAFNRILEQYKHSRTLENKKISRPETCLTFIYNNNL